MTMNEYLEGLRSHVERKKERERERKSLGGCHKEWKERREFKAQVSLSIINAHVREFIFSVPESELLSESSVLSLHRLPCLDWDPFHSK